MATFNQENQKVVNQVNNDSTMIKSLEALKDSLKVQCSDGNWNYDPYMHGMANGMIFALSLFEGGEPQYLDAPEKWGKDRPDLKEPITQDHD